MLPGNGGTFEVNGRSFVLGIVELPNIFQQKASLLSHFLLRPNSILRFLSRRPLLMDRPYWQENQLRNWHLSEPAFRVKDDASLEPYSLIHQRLFDDIINDQVTIAVEHEDVQLPSPYDIYLLPTISSMESQISPPADSKKLQKAPLFTLNSSRSSSIVASPIATFFCATPTLVNWHLENSKTSSSDSDSSEELILPMLAEFSNQEIITQTDD